MCLTGPNRRRKPNLPCRSLQGDPGGEATVAKASCSHAHTASPPPATLRLPAMVMGGGSASYHAPPPLRSFRCWSLPAACCFCLPARLCGGDGPDGLLPAMSCGGLRLRVSPVPRFTFPILVGSAATEGLCVGWQWMNSACSAVESLVTTLPSLPMSVQFPFLLVYLAVGSILSLATTSSAQNCMSRSLLVLVPSSKSPQF
uniref:Uncharacterized protein n=1 Tax=Oryza meridionalis TaxID=40149 RepID=A0A0E0CLP3_9ORYZ